MDSRFHSIFRKWPDQHCQDSPRRELLAMGRIMQATNPFHSIDTSELRSHGRHYNYQQHCHHHIQHQQQMCSSSRGGFQRRSGWPVAAGSQSTAMPSPSIQSPHDTLRAQEQSSVSMQYGGDPPPSHHTVSCLSHVFIFCLCLQDSSGKCVSALLDIRSLLHCQCLHGAKTLQCIGQIVRHAIEPPNGVSSEWQCVSHRAPKPPVHSQMKLHVSCAFKLTQAFYGWGSVELMTTAFERSETLALPLLRHDIRVNGRMEEFRSWSMGPESSMSTVCFEGTSIIDVCILPLRYCHRRQQYAVNVRCSVQQDVPCQHKIFSR
jgi:hypothetical protein